jgi:rhamnulokinase
VLAGPVEATAAGNVMVQAMAERRVDSLAEIREVIAASTSLATYEPADTSAWGAARERFHSMLSRSV